MLLLNTTLLSEKFIFAEVTMNVVIIPADEDDDAESSSRYNFFKIGFNGQCCGTGTGTVGTVTF
jgi:hypothetical protein